MGGNHDVAIAEPPGAPQPCKYHGGLVKRIDQITTVLGVADNPLELEQPEYANTVLGMLIKGRQDWRMVKWIGVGVIIATVGAALYVEHHTDKQVREMATQILSMKDALTAQNDSPVTTTTKKRN